MPVETLTSSTIGERPTVDMKFRQQRVTLLSRMNRNAIGNTPRLNEHVAAIEVKHESGGRFVINSNHGLATVCKLRAARNYIRAISKTSVWKSDGAVA
jgi:hypothetical protein